MKPPVFKYVRVTSLEEALAALAEYGEDGKIIAGGQSLVPMMNFRIVEPAVLIDINPVQELDYVRVENDSLRIGARTRQRTLETSPDVRASCPLLAEAVKWVGHPQIRNRGTIGGSLVHGDPTAELALVVTLLNAEFVIQGKGGRRTVRPDDFFEGLMATRIGENEILTQVSCSVIPPRSGYGFQELCIRHGDFAVVAAAVQVTLGDDGRCAETRVAVSGAGPRPARMGGAEAALIGKDGSPKDLEAAAASVCAAVDPVSDLKGSADYRREMAKVFVRRALEEAWSKARRGQ